MNNWLFESENINFSLELPENWTEYEDDDNTAAFFNTGEWSGNLRITTFYLPGKDINIDKVSEYIKSELSDNPNAQLIKLGKWDAAFYSDDLEDGNIIYYWITGTNPDLFLCSFTFDKSFLDAENHNKEIILVTDILRSITLI
jgi:hypothetical protein